MNTKWSVGIVLTTCAMALGAFSSESAGDTITHSTTNLSRKVYQLAATSVGDLVLFGGGLYTGHESDVVDIYDASTDSWTTATLSQERASLTATSVGSKALFAGGTDGSGNGFDRVDIYDASSGQWSTASLIVGRHNMSSTSVGGKALFAGGSVNGSVVDIYDAASGEWSMASLAVARQGMGATSVGHYALFAGGEVRPSGGLSDIVDIYDAQTGQWTTAKLSCKRSNLAATSVGNLALFAGGYASRGTGSTYSSVVDIFNADTGEWTTATLSQGRSYLAAASVGDLAFFAGGTIGSSTYSDVVDVFDASTGEWSTTTNLDEERWWFAGASVDDKVLFAGGNSSTLVEVYTVTPGPGSLGFLGQGQTVPEPMTLTLVGLGSLLMLGVRSRQARKARGLWVVLCVMFLCLPTARADDITWDHAPGTPGDWFDPFNWDLDRLPTLTDTAYVDNNGTVLIDSDGATTYNLNIGYSGIGALIQSTGTMTITRYLQLGYDPGSLGIYYLTNATLDLSANQCAMYVGYDGEGDFMQTGGSVTIDRQLHLGQHSGSEGTYTLSGDGTLTSGWLTLGADGLATFIQNSGTNTITTSYRGFRIGTGNGSEGTYELRGGNLIAGQTELGEMGTGTITQSGTANAILGTLYIGGNPDAALQGTGTYELSGSGYLNNPTTHVGYGGTGHFNQSGATNTVTTLNVGTCDSNSEGSYELSGGTLSVLDEYIGTPGTGSFTQTGGFHRVWRLEVGPQGSYDLSGGTLEVNDRAVIEGSGEFTTGPWTIEHTAGLADFSGATITDASLATFRSSSASALTIFPNGFDAETDFGTCEALGLTHSAGSTLVVPASHDLVFWGYINDPVHIQGGSITNHEGSIMASSLCIDLRGGFTLSEGGRFTDTYGYEPTAHTLIIDDGNSGCIEASGGQLIVEEIRVGQSGVGSMTQHAGTVDISYGMRLGTLAGSEGTYTMHGGTLDVERKEYIGYSGTGHFIQTSGVHTPSNALTIGDRAAGSGSYELGGTGELHCNYLTVGWMGDVTFEQTGGVLLNTGDTMVADCVQSQSTYYQSNGSASHQRLVVGDSGQGAYVHTGGTNTVIENIYLGRNAGGQGTYELGGTAELYADNIFVGGGGTGEFIHNGGTYHLTGNIYLGDNGIYTQNTGELKGDILYVGSDGESTFNFNGGSLEFNSLILGQDTGDLGRMNIAGTGTVKLNMCSVGDLGGGSIEQTGGNVNVQTDLFVGDHCDGGYVISGNGDLVANKIYVGRYGAGTFHMDGGNVNVDAFSLGSETNSNGALTIGTSSFSAIRLYVGSLGGGTMDIIMDNADITVSDTLHLGADSTLAAVPGSTIHMTGTAFENENTDPADLVGLANLHLIYDGHTGDTDPFETAGSDLGRDPAGFVGNFALGGITLEDDAVLQLVDLFDNAHRGGVGGSAEALYLTELTMLMGSTLDLNGKHLYVRDLDYQGGDILNGDLISLLPGDADGNWCVDSADLALWQSNYDPLGNNPNTFAMGDFDGDGLINSGDLALWQSNYSPIGPGLAETIPEPTTMLLLGTGALCLAGLMRRRLMS